MARRALIWDWIRAETVAVIPSIAFTLKLANEEGGKRDEAA